MARLLEVPSSPSVVAAALGSEDRVRVSPSSPAHASVVFLETLSDRDDLLTTCTGTIVGSRVVLTAAHCLWSSDPDDTPAARVRVVPGKNGFSEPWGSQTSTQWLVPPEFKNPASVVEEYRHDFGLILLPDRSMTDRTGSMPGGLAVLPDGAFTNASFRFAAVGYPYDCNDRACGEDAFATLYGQGDYVWLAPSSFAWASPDFVYHDSDEYSGMSGGPLLRTSDLAVTAIVSAGDAFLDRGVRLTRPVVERMVSWCQQNGCSLNLAPQLDTAFLPHRALAIGVAADSPSGVCAGEREFLEEFAETGGAWSTAVAEFAGMIGGSGFNPDSPAWREEFGRVYGATEAAARRVILLEPPDARFEAYHHQVDEGLEAFIHGMELEKRAVDENSQDLTWEAVDVIWTALERFEDAQGLYPGLELGCLAPLGSPFGLPPARG